MTDRCQAGCLQFCEYHGQDVAGCHGNVRLTIVPASTNGDRPEVVRGDEVRMRSIRWLDKPFLQRGTFHLFAGPKGTGKGTKVAGIAAAFMNGEYGDDNRNVIYVSSEDSMEVDSVPRLVAAGAGDNLAHVHFVTRHIRFPQDIGWLRDLARQIGNVGMIVIDPIGNHLGGADTDKEGAVRNAIGDLNGLADALDAVIVGVRHLAKNTSAGALASILGSTAWRDIPRAVIAFARDDEDENVIHWQVVAGNRSGRGTARHFRIELADVRGLEEPVTRAADLGSSAKDVDDLLEAKPASKSASARELILDILEKEGEVESDALDARVARETGLAAKTIKNNRTKLKDEGLIRNVPDRDEHGTVKRWKVTRTQAPRAA